MKTLTSLLLLVPLLQASASAAIIFQDTFNRADSRNPHASLTGITDATGTLTAGNVYSFPHLDPNAYGPTYGVQDGTAANGGGVQVLGNVLQLATGAGTANAYVNHNFTDASILSAGGFSVSVDVTTFTNTTNQFGGAFAVGMSQAEANATGDAYDGATRMTGVYSGTIGSTVPTQVTSDFWIGLRGDNSLAWGSNTGSVQGVTGLAAKTGTISVNFFLSSFDAGSTVNYEVYLNSALKGTGSFVWSGTAENFIGLDARDPGFVGYDNFTVSTVPEASSAALLASAAAGLALVRRRR